MEKKNAMTEEQIRSLLQAQRVETEAMLAANDGNADPVTLDQTQQGRLSRMDALQQQAMAAETQRRRLRQLQMIDAALQRLDEGEYGYCAACGEAIEPNRLALDPAVAVCIAHAR